MPFRILEPILHGIDNQVFKLKPGEIIPDDFLQPDEIQRQLSLKNIEEVQGIHENPEPPTKDKEIEPLQDISKMTVPEVREFLEDHVEVSELERYLDQENSRGAETRKTVVDYISRRIKELTGF